MKKKSKGAKSKSKLEGVALVFGGIAIATVVVISSGGIGGSVDASQTASVGSTWSIFVPSTWGM